MLSPMKVHVTISDCLALYIKITLIFAYCQEYIGRLHSEYCTKAFLISLPSMITVLPATSHTLSPVENVENFLWT
jgi:hypothetical protein